MRKPGMAAVFMAVALLTYAVLVQAQTAGDDATGAGAAGQQDSAMQAGSQQGAGQQGQQDPQKMQQKFVKDALSGNQFEIESARLAQERAQRQEVKDFARELTQHHEQANQQLQPIAEQMGIQGSEQQKLNPVHKAQLDELRQLDGQAFDRAWVYTQLADHQKEILCYRDVAQEAQDPQLKQYAQQTLPLLQQHMERAAELAGVGQAGTASDIQSPSGAAGAGGQHDMDQGGQTGQTGQTGQGQ